MPERQPKPRSNPSARQEHPSTAANDRAPVSFASREEVRAAAERGRQQIVTPTLASLQLEGACQAADFDAFASIVGGWKREHREELDEMRDSVLVLLERVAELWEKSRESNQRFDRIEEALDLRREATK